MTSNSGPFLMTAQSSSVRRSEVGSAQCKSSSTSTVGPLETSLETTVATASKVARCNCSALSCARTALFSRWSIPMTTKRSAAHSLSGSLPKMAFRLLSRAARTVSWFSSRATPAHTESNCW